MAVTAAVLRPLENASAKVRERVAHLLRLGRRKIVKSCLIRKGRRAVPIALGILLLCQAVATAGHLPVEVYLFPDDGAEEAVLHELQGAHDTLDVAAHSFTSQAIAEVLAELGRKGVKVRLLLDGVQRLDPSVDSVPLAQSGVVVKFYEGPGRMYNRFTVVDGKTLMLGSFPEGFLPGSANQDNLIVVRDPEIVALYLTRFEAQWQSTGNCGHGHAFYVSKQARTFYYCETDPAWKDLKPENLLRYESEKTLRADFPKLVLHKTCEERAEGPQG